MHTDHFPLQRRSWGGGSLLRKNEGCLRVCTDQWGFISDVMHPCFSILKYAGNMHVSVSFMGICMDMRGGEEEGWVGVG